MKRNIIVVASNSAPCNMYVSIHIHPEGRMKPHGTLGGQGWIELEGVSIHIHPEGRMKLGLARRTAPR